MFLVNIPNFVNAQAVYGHRLSIDREQDPDTANIGIVYPSGNANLTGRVHYVSYETLADSLSQFISGGSGVTNGDKGDITVSGSTWTIDNGLAATKIADGSVSNAELQYIGTLTSDAQTQILNRITFQQALAISSLRL